MIRTILLPVDESPLSTRAIEFVAREHPEASVHLLHVLDRVDADLDIDGTSVSSNLDRPTAEVVENGRRVLEESREVAEGEGLTVAATELATGRPARQITVYASENGVDLVVMGSHGRSGLSRIVLGSITERVLRASTVPVTVVR